MIGTNSLDVEQLSQGYGIGRGASLNTGATQEGMQQAFRGVSAGVQRSRTGESQGVEFTETERMSSGGRWYYKQINKQINKHYIIVKYIPIIDNIIPQIFVIDNLSCK